MNKNEFIKMLAARTGQSQSQVSNVLDTVLGTLSDAVKECDDVILQDFGKFSLKTVPAHNGRNPRTGEPIEIPEKQVVRFKPFTGFLTYRHKHQ
jgi:DNA-binding protein HU-beta